MAEMKAIKGKVIKAGTVAALFVAKNMMGRLKNKIFELDGRRRQRREAPIAALQHAFDAEVDFYFVGILGSGLRGVRQCWVAKKYVKICCFILYFNVFTTCFTVFFRDPLYLPTLGIRVASRVV